MSMNYRQRLVCFFKACKRSRLYVFSLLVLLPCAVAPATKSGDNPVLAGQIAKLEKILPTIRDRAAVLFFLAYDYARMGNFDRSLTLLKECIEADEGFDPSGDPEYEPIKKRSDFLALIDRVHRIFPPVHRAQIAFVVPEKDVIPEGLAVDSGNGTFYMGSLHRRSILRIDPHGVIADFVKVGHYDFGPVCGIKVDPQDHSVWANTCSNSGAHAELLHFDRNGKLLDRFGAPTPGKHLFNDLVIVQNKIYLTDSLANAVYQFDSRTRTFARISFSRALHYPNGIAISGDGRLLYVADAFGVLEVDLRSMSAQEVDPGPHNTLAQADGLYWYEGSLVAVQNGIGSARVAQFRLSTDGLKVTKAVILEYRTEFVTLPTTGAILNGEFYFMGNTQLDNLNDENKIVNPQKLEPIRVGTVKLEDLH